MSITPQQARAELARRELERRSIGIDQQSESPSFIEQIKQAFLDTPKTLLRGIAEPIVKNIIARPMQTVESLISKQPPTEFDYPFPGSLGGPIKVKPLQTMPQAAGAGVQTAALLLPGTPAVAGALYGGGQAVEEQKNIGDILKQTATGAAFGKTVGVLSGQPLLTGRTGKIIETGVKKTKGFINPITRSVRKYKTLRKGSQFEGVRSDLTPLERVENLKSQAKEKYTVPLRQEKEQLKQQLKNISEKEKLVLGKSKSAIEQSKSKLSQDIDNLSGRMKEETTHLRDNIELASQRSAIEGKRRFSQFTKENSSAYGQKLDDIINIAEQEGKLPTKQVLQGIFDKTDDEITKTFIDTGAPLTKYNALKDKYLGGFTSEANPEAQALAKGLGFKKGQMKNAGIDWSRVDITQSGIEPPNPNAPINLKGLLQDIRSVSKAISAKAKGAERAFTDEDLVSVIFQKNIGEHMASTYPEFAKLQKNYAPIIEQMKAGRKIFKPGTPYDLGTAPKVLAKPDIAEQKLISELESGTKGFSKGVGEISQPVKKAQQKLAGVERGYEIAKSRIEKLNATEQKELGELFKIREEAYRIAKEKVTLKSLIRQKQIKDDLNRRLQDLEKGSFRGKEKISKLTAREKITGREKKIATGGGIATMVDYLIRRLVARSVLR